MKWTGEQNRNKPNYFRIIVNIDGSNGLVVRELIENKSLQIQYYNGLEKLVAAVASATFLKLISDMVTETL